MLATIFLGLSLVSLTLGQNVTFCSTFNINLIINDNANDTTSNIQYNQTLTLTISQGGKANLTSAGPSGINAYTTNATLSAQPPAKNPESYALTNLNFVVGPEENQTDYRANETVISCVAKLPSGSSCFIPGRSRHVDYIDTTKPVTFFTATVGGNNVIVRVNLPGFYRGESFDYVGGQFHAYSSFTSRSYTTLLNATVNGGQRYAHATATCASQSPGYINNAVFDPKKPICKSFGVSQYVLRNLQVTNPNPRTSTEVLQEFSANIIQRYSSNQTLVEDIQITRQPFNIQQNMQQSKYIFLGCTNTNMTRSACSPNLMSVNVKPPVFWFMDSSVRYKDYDDTIYMTSAAVPLVLTCDDPGSNCTKATAFQYFLYDKMLDNTGLAQPYQVDDAPIYPLLHGLWARSFVQCNEWVNNNTNTNCNNNNSGGGSSAAVRIQGQGMAMIFSVILVVFNIFV